MFNCSDVLKSHDPIVTAAVAAITREAQQQAMGSGLYVEAAGDAARSAPFAHLRIRVTFREPSGEGRLSPAQVRRLTDYIETRLHEQLNLETLAAVAGMGVWTFTRHFRESFGRTPHAYVIERRIDRARRLLAQSRLPIKEVASVCGFADQAHMTRVFQSAPAHYASNAAPLARGGTVSFKRLPFSFKTRAWLKFQNDALSADVRRTQAQP
jgi:AraC family transcriptional regulator